MNLSVIQRLRFPREAGTAALCFAHGSTARLDTADPDRPAYRFLPGRTLDSSSYLNSFYEFPYRLHGEAREFVLRLRLAGDFRIEISSVGFLGRPRTVFRAERRGCTPEEPVTAPLPPAAPGAANQRLSFTLTALSEGAFYGGDVATPHPPRPVRLAAVICTYKREEFVRATLAALLADPDLAGRLAEVVVVDNGRTLDPAAFAAEFPDPRAVLVPNRNCGGSGGFSRGMAEVLDRGRATHVLLMDDDILCDTEAVLRTIAFYEHAAAPVAVSGAMLDLMMPHMLYEAGALYGCAGGLAGTSPIRIMGLKKGLCLEQSAALNMLTLDERPDYGAWWFFAFPVECCRKYGLALPFFVIGDDIEFGLRLTRRAGVPILPLPGTGVWHMPFYSKYSRVKRYFFIRNLLVVDALYQHTPYRRVALALWHDFLSDLYKFNYGAVLMLVRGFEDFLRGPDFLTHVEPEPLMTGLNDAGKRLDDNLRPYLPQDTREFKEVAPHGFVRNLVREFTLGGHLLPRTLLCCRPMHILITASGQWRKNFLCRRALFLHPTAGVANAREIENRRGIRLALRLARDLLFGRRAWRRAGRAWRREAPRLASPEFWKAYCAVRDPSSKKD